MATLEQVELNANAVIKQELTTSGIPVNGMPVIQVQDVHKYYDLRRDQGARSTRRGYDD